MPIMAWLLLLDIDKFLCWFLGLFEWWAVIILCLYWFMCSFFLILTSVFTIWISISCLALWYMLERLIAIHICIFWNMIYWCRQWNPNTDPRIPKPVCSSLQRHWTIRLLTWCAIPFWGIPTQRPSYGRQLLRLLFCPWSSSPFRNSAASRPHSLPCADASAGNSSANWTKRW